jgi:putative membrane protein
MKAFHTLTAAATALVATPAFAQAMAPAEYVANAGASDLYERQSSELVSQSTRDLRIREFAQMMITHHTKSTADVTSAARQARVPVPPPRLNPLQAEMIAQLRAATGPARDAAYVAQQKAAHGQALNLHKAYAMEGTAPPLRAAAATIVPVVQRHIQMLMTM